MRIAALLVAGGTGQRYGGPAPKQFAPLAGKPPIRWAAEALLPHVSVLQPVGDPAAIDAALAGLPHRPAAPAGATRAASVKNGLAALALQAPDLVLVHDAARPLIPPGTIEALLAALEHAPGAIPACPVSDTLKRGQDGFIAGTVSRAGLHRAQTPQAFHFDVLRKLHDQPGADHATDDAWLLEQAGHRVAIVPGSENNVKLTHPEDAARLAPLLAPLTPRIGTGFDVHAFADGRRLILCGIEIPHPRGLAGHSDADVGIHALCDAIYGALNEGDIGRHFPPSEAAWRDADSARFLRHAAARIAARGGRLANADLTLICERPKIGPHAAAMQARLAALLAVDPAIVSVKATTTERLGFTGREEGIAAQAAVIVMLP